MTTTPIAPDVPVPDGAVPAGSEDFKAWGSEYRVVTTPDRVVTGRDNDARVWGWRHPVPRWRYRRRWCWGGAPRLGRGQRLVWLWGSTQHGWFMRVPV